MPIAGPYVAPDVVSTLVGDAHVCQTHRLLVGATFGPGAAGHSQSYRRLIAEPRALRHRHTRLRRHGAVALECVVLHSELMLLQVVAVADQTARVELAR